MKSASPLFSIVTPVYNTPIGILEKTIESVVNQTFGDWEFILVDDRSPDESVRRTLRRAAADDGRIKLIERTENGGISVASNDAVNAATGEYLALLDHDDLLTTDALEVMAEAIAASPTADYLYSDEDKVFLDGARDHPFRKPDWSPERFRHQMYTCHLSVLRTSLVRELGGFDSAYDGSQDHDLVLRVTEKARRVVHVPRVLYSWRIMPGSAALSGEEKPYAWEAGRKAVQAQLDRLGIDGSVEFGNHRGHYKIRRNLGAEVKVSLVIPTRGSRGMMWGMETTFVVEAVRSCLTTTDHPNVEVVVVYDTSTPPEVLEALRDLVPADRLVLVPFAEPFNFSKKCNLGVLESTGDMVVLLNDDILAVGQGWLEQLVAPLLEKDVGITGARLLFEDRTLQHAGLAYCRGHYHQAFYRTDSYEPGPYGLLDLNRECSGVTAACCAVRRETFHEVGGLTEMLPASFNDVDFSLKVIDAGYRVLWICDIEMFHFESRSRDPVVREWENEFVDNRWGVRHRDFDPYLPEFW